MQSMMLLHTHFMLFRATHLCHSEEHSDVRISRKGLLIKAPQVHSILWGLFYNKFMLQKSEF